jgi:hypothetical protein
LCKVTGRDIFSADLTLDAAEEWLTYQPRFGFQGGFMSRSQLSCQIWHQYLFTYALHGLGSVLLSHRAFKAAGRVTIVVAGMTAYSLAFAATASVEAEKAQWRETMLHKATPGVGCFQASFPATRWTPAACHEVTGHSHPLPRAAQSIVPETVGNGNDYALTAPGANLITKTVGSFPSVRGVTSESSVGVPAFGGGGVLGPNEYTLQINTNSNSSTSACSGGDPACTVWQQYLYAPDQLTAGKGGVFIQYWLLGYGASGASCPGGYTTSQTSCFMNSSAVEAPDTPITGLGNLQLTGTAAAGGNDTVSFFDGTTVYTVTASDSVLKIGTVWNQSEFNVVGDAGGSEAVFNTGSVITVNVAAQYGSTTKPTCAPGAGTTGETNNLNLLPCSAAGGATPSIQFVESLTSPPGISKAFSPTSILLNGTSTVTLTLTNPNTGIDLTGAAFTDALSGISAAGGAVGGTCVGTSPATLSAGAQNLGFSNITIPAGASCTVTFAVTNAIPGVFPNTTSGVSSNEALTGSPSNTVTLVVIAPPAITKSFAAPTIPLNQNTTLTFKITNPNATVTLNGVGFTDLLPAGLVVAAAPTSVGCGAPSITGAPGSVNVSGATIVPGGTCTITVSITATAAGTKNNTTSNVTSTNGGIGNTASATLVVLAPPTITKSFADAEVQLFSGFTALSFTISNPAVNPLPLTGVGFVDNLPAGLIVLAPDNGLTGSCFGGTITAVPGSSSISLTGATLPVNGSCTFSVLVNGAQIGVWTNTTNPVTSTNGGTGLPATATTSVDDLFFFWFFAA